MKKIYRRYLRNEYLKKKNALIISIIHITIDSTESRLISCTDESPVHPIIHFQDLLGVFSSTQRKSLTLINCQ